MFKHFTQSSQKGFTLIELLTVIAIVGILAAIILVSLGAAKAKGEDAGIQGLMKSVQNQASIYHAQNGTFGAVASDCATGMFADATTYGLAKLVAAVQAKSSAVACFATVSPLGWAVSAQLKSDATKYWCVDSVGSSRQRTAAATSTAQSCIGN
jgi:prepilin-type N-terminal cleavage/methylation domain-containing protein